jgi:outer membrane protein TolC
LKKIKVNNKFKTVIKSFQMKISSVFLTMLLMYTALPIMAQTQPGTGLIRFSLNEAKNYALNNSPVLLNSARDVEMAKKKLWENTATGLPQADLSSSYAYSPKLAGLSSVFTGGDTTGGGGGSPFGFSINPEDLKTSFSMNVRVTQLIFSGQYIVGLKAAKVYAGLSELANNKSEIGIIESITTTYFTALIAREAKVILDSTLRTVQKTLYETEQLYANGFAESTDVDQLKILVSNIKSSLSVTERQIELMERLLKFQMGIPIDQSILLTDQIDPLITVMNLEAAILDSFKLENNIDYQMLTTQEKLMKLNMQVKMAQYLPTLAGFYNRYEDFDNNLFNDQSPNMFGLSLNLPLWTSGQRNSQVSQSRLDYMKAQTNKQMGSESLLIQYETALSEFLSARDIYVMQKESRNLALHIYEKSLKRFTEGMGSSLDLNQTQSQYFDAEGKYFNALMSLVSAKSKLESLLANSSN